MRVGVTLNQVSVITWFHFKRKKTLFRLAKRLVKAGAQQIEILGDLFYVKDYGQDYLRQEIDALLPLKKQGIKFSLHAPCISVVTGSHFPAIREAGIETIINVYQFMAELEPVTVTVHPNALEAVMRELKTPSKYNRKYLIRRAQKYENYALQELSKIIPSEKICMENYYDSDLKYYKRIIKKNNNSVCFDIGHYIMQNFGPNARKNVKKGTQLPYRIVEIEDCRSIPKSEKYVDLFFKKWKERRIGNIHIHNVRQKQAQRSGKLIAFTDHQPITDPRGIINIEEVCRRIKKFGYNKAIVIEEHQKNSTESVRFLREILEKIQTNS